MSHIGLDVTGAIATITLDRPTKLNALTPAMLEDLAAAADQIDRDTGVRAVILRGAGDRAFSAGADIDAWSRLAAADMWRRWIRDGQRVFDRLAALRQPMIAMLDGVAFGGGLELALTADIRVAEQRASLALPEVAIGIVPGWSAPDRLVPLIGPSYTKLLALTGESIDAAEARRIGLVDVVCATGTGPQTAQRLATAIAARAPIAVQLTKQMINAANGEGAAATIAGATAAFAAATADCQEGIASFHDKRTPRFSNT